MNRVMWINLVIFLAAVIYAWIFRNKSFKYLKNEYKDVDKKINSDPFFLYRSSSYKNEKGVKYKNASLLIVISGFLIMIILSLIFMD